MRMCALTALYTVILVFGITAVGFLLGKLNRFGDSDEIIDGEERAE